MKREMKKTECVNCDEVMETFASFRFIAVVNLFINQWTPEYVHKHDGTDEQGLFYVLWVLGPVFYGHVVKNKISCLNLTYLLQDRASYVVNPVVWGLPEGCQLFVVYKTSWKAAALLATCMSVHMQCWCHLLDCNSVLEIVASDIQRLLEYGKFQDLDPFCVTVFQTKIVDISLNIARTDLYQPPKWPQFCLDYDSRI